MRGARWEVPHERARWEVPHEGARWEVPHEGQGGRYLMRG